MKHQFVPPFNGGFQLVIICNQRKHINSFTKAREIHNIFRYKTQPIREEALDFFS